jgi:hypothetical protein
MQTDWQKGGADTTKFAQAKAAERSKLKAES